MILGRSIVLYNVAFKAVVLALMALGVLSITDAATDALTFAVSCVLDLVSANNVTSTANVKLKYRKPADRHESTLAQLQKHGL